MNGLTHFVGIDWSGAKGVRHPGIAVAVCTVGDETPQIILPPSGRASWGRQECGDWIAGGCGLAEGARMLVGIDSAFSMPFVDEGGYLGAHFGVSRVKALWQEIETVCVTAEDFYGGPFVSAHKRHYFRTGERGDHYSRRMRMTETRAVASGAGPCESVFHLIGPSQVGLSGLSTMRLLSQLEGRQGLRVWPYDNCDDACIVLVEIYAAAFAALGGHRGKVRDLATLNSVLHILGSRPFYFGNVQITDHISDALITSAALRKIAHERKYWRPELLSTKVRETEGWVFGIL